jgi:hypothetical protein
MLFLGIVFLFPTTPKTDVADMNYTVVVLWGALILSLVWYFMPRYGGMHWFTGPVANIDKMGMEVKGLDNASEEGEISGKGSAEKTSS